MYRFFFISLLSLFIYVFIPPLVWAQCSNVQWLGPDPQANTLKSVHFPDDNTGYAVGETGAIIKTTDGGYTWVTLQSGITTNLRSVYFTDVHTGYAVGDHGTIIKTLDGGNTWLTLPSGASGFLTSVFFVDATTGYAAGFLGLMLKTTNGGSSWTTLRTEMPYSLESIYFTDVHTGYAVGAHGTIIKTADGGLTWTRYKGILLDYFTSVWFTDAKTGYALGYQFATKKRIMKTTDGGNSWSFLPDVSPGSFYSIHFKDANSGYIAGYNGKIMETNDGGNTWRSVGYSDTVGLTLYAVWATKSKDAFAVGTYGMIYKKSNEIDPYYFHAYTSTLEGFYSVAFTDVKTGYAVSGGGFIGKTIDGGTTWKLLARGPNSYLYDVAFINPDTGFAVGAYETILSTTNAGKSWQKLSSGTTNNLSSVFFINQQVGYCVGENSTILKTIDSGKSWVTQISPIVTNLFSVHFIDINHGYTVGTNGTILKTTDGGNNWVQLKSGTSYRLHSVFFTDAQTGYTVGEGGIILKTIDSGNSWFDISKELNQYTSLNSIVFTSPNTGYVVGGCSASSCEYNGIILETIDAGKTWTAKANSATSGFSTIATYKDTIRKEEIRCIVGGRNVFTSSQENKEWRAVNKYPEDKFDFEAIYFINATTGFAVGNTNSPTYSTVAKTIDAGKSWTISRIGNGLLHSVFFFDSLTGFALGSNLYKTTDAGERWELLSKPGTGYLNSIYFTSSTSGYIVGDDGQIFKTIDGGVTWIKLNSNTTKRLRKIYFTDATTGYIMGDEDILLKTIDGGATWSFLNIGMRNYIQYLHFTDSQTGYMISGGSTAGSIISKTTDGGESWTTLSTTNLIFTSARFINDSTFYAVGPVGSIYKTVDRGKSWSQQSKLTNNTLHDVWFTENNIGYAVGDNRTMLQITDKELSSLTTASSNKPKVGETLQLQASTVPGATYQWSGPNGFTSVEQNPFRKNAQASMQGTYRVIAIVDGCKGPASSIQVEISTIPSLNLAADSISGQMNNLVNIPIRVKGFTNIVSVQFTLSWDPKVATFIGTEQYGLPGLNAASFGTTHISSGKLTFSWFESNLQPQTLSDQTTLFALSFKLIGNAGENSPLFITNSPTAIEITNQKSEVIPVSLVAGQIHIQNTISFTGKIRTEQLIPIQGVSLEVKAGHTTQKVSNSSDGTYFIELPQASSYSISPYKANDLITNNGISTLDIALIRRHILGIESLASVYKMLAADVDRSNTITTLDLVALRKVILTIDNAFPQGRKWVFIPSDYQFTNPANPFPLTDTLRVYDHITTSLINQDFIGIKLGDINDSWDNRIGRITAGDSLKFNMYDQDVAHDDEITVPVTVSNFEQISGYQFTLNWDPKVLQFLAIEEKTLQGAFGTHKVAEGKLTTTWDELQGKSQSLKDSSTAFELKFKVIGKAGQHSSVNITSALTQSLAYNSEKEEMSINARDAKISIVEEIAEIKQVYKGYQLYQNLPNPFSQTTQIKFSIPQTEKATLIIYNIFGQVVKKFSGVYSSGEHILEWEGNDMNGNRISSGTYFYQLRAGKFVDSKKVIVL